MLISYSIDYIKTEDIGPYKICLQKFYRGSFARYRVLVTDVFYNNNASGFYESIKDAELRFDKFVEDTKSMLNSDNKNFILDNRATALTTNEYYYLVINEMKEDIIINIHSYRDAQHLYYGTVHFSRDKDRGIFYDLYVPVANTSNSVDLLNEEYSDPILIDPNNINEENDINNILDKYGYDNISGLAAFKFIIAEAINNYRENNMPTPFDIRQKFLTGEYTEKDLDEAVRLRWISADQALKFIKYKAHIKMDDLYNKHKNISIINFNTDKEDNEE